MKRSTVRLLGMVSRRVAWSRRSTKLKAVCESSVADHSGRAKIGCTISQPSASASRRSPKRLLLVLRGRLDCGGLALAASRGVAFCACCVGPKVYSELAF